MKAQVLILDFGAQYTQLIARLVRELGVYCEVVPGNAPPARLLEGRPRALLLSGGPASVRDRRAPLAAPEVLRAGIPLFGICYGMQVIAREFGGLVEGWGRSAAGEVGGAVDVDPAGHSVREFGRATVTVTHPRGPFSFLGRGEEVDVWMSHGDKVTGLPDGFSSLGSSAGSPTAIFGDEARKIYGVQFHPEVHHTPRGREMLASFLFDVAGVERDWDPENFVAETVSRIAAQAPTGKVVCALSGGVDSAVAALLVHRAVGPRLRCVFVDNGLLRAGEATEVMAAMQELGLNVHLAECSARFLRELRGVSDPEEKRKVVGRVFIEIFEEEAGLDAQYLVQGTLYPDVIESTSVFGDAAVIKSHHNVGGLIDGMKLKLIEPLRDLFKDEVRQIGRELGMPERFVVRQPFPGPGLAVRCLGEIAEERLEKLRLADQIVREEIERWPGHTALWQWFAVLLPVRSVGVMGDGRTFEEAVAIRLVSSRDGMTADWVWPPEEVLRRTANRIVNETPGVNRVVCDVTSKPPATIEWE